MLCSIKVGRFTEYLSLRGSHCPIRLRIGEQRKPTYFCTIFSDLILSLVVAAAVLMRMGFDLFDLPSR